MDTPSFDHINDALPCVLEGMPPEYPVVILTKNAAVEYLERFYHAGIDDQPVALMRELHDEISEDPRNALEFTDVQFGDVTDKMSFRQFVDQYELWQLWRR